MRERRDARRHECRLLPSSAVGKPSPPAPPLRIPLFLSRHYRPFSSLLNLPVAQTFSPRANSLNGHPRSVPHARYDGGFCHRMRIGPLEPAHETIVPGTTAPSANRLGARFSRLLAALLH